MTAQTLKQSFEDRNQEIDAYLQMLEALERQVQTGPPKIGGSAITGQQQRILYSSVYLQLYNLVEATVTWCVDGVTAAAADGKRWQPSDLTLKVRKEWLRDHAQTHVNLNFENRLDKTIELFNFISSNTPVSPWSVEKGGGGNWDDCEIEDISLRLGCDLRVSPKTYSDIKRVIRNDKSALSLIKDFRNRLAHGAMSFAECGDGVTVSDLRDIKNRTVVYLQEVVMAFSSYIESYEFLVPTSRPLRTGTE